MKKSKSQKTEKEKENESSPTSESGSDFLIVGIGASAGGVQALRTFFENVPADSGAAYVVILHLSPDHDSRLTEILQSVSKIPVEQVTEKVKVEANHVYVVSPDESLTMRDGYIIVSPIHTVEERRAPVDIFFRTLAESHCARAVAVVLSGTGANGSMGIKRVKENGGAAFVQNPREAEFSEMPRNSIATELIDEVLNVAEIPRKIIAYSRNLGKIVIPVEAENREEEQQAALREIFTLLRVRTGHDFSNYKRPTVLRRIERRINVRTLPDLPQYAGYLKENPDETQALLKDLLISVTNFFRDKEAFKFLEREIVPLIVNGKKSGDQIRLWVAGCATGEEAYSLAMLLVEQINGRLDTPSIQIFATDIDDAAIQAARGGFYTLNDAADVSPERLRRFFTKEKDGFRVRRELREMVLFAKHNLLKDPPFSKLDLVTCRNLLIYFNGAAQERAMETFHFALKSGAFMFLGSSESVDGAGDLFAPVNREQRVFQARQVAPRFSHPVPDLSPSYSLNSAPLAADEKNISLPPEKVSYGDLHQEILEQYAPPSLIINEMFEIVHVSQHAGRYLQIAGEPSHNLFKLIRPDLRLALSTAVYQAVERGKSVEAKNLKFQTDDSVEAVNVSVRPVLRRNEKQTRGFLLIIFEPSNHAPDDTDAEAVLTANEPLSVSLRGLEEALLRSQTQYRQSVEQSEVQAEELKASNEELQAINEELRSATEELETGKEELQSVNEELITVNQELKIKIEELSLSNSDLQNLVNSTNIGTIFLDRRFRVKMFTPTAREIFKLIPADLGRDLSDITHHLEGGNLISELETVLSDLTPIEREVRTTGGNFYLMQITPYRTSEDKIGGIIVTFVNITTRKQAETALSEALRDLERQSRIFNTTLSSIADFAYIFDRDGRFVYSNQPLLDLLGITLETITGKNFFDLNYPEDSAARLQNQIQKVFETGEIVRDEMPFTSPTGAGGFYEYIFSPVKGSDGAVELVAGSTRDVTERKQSEQDLRESEERLRLIINSVEDYAIITTDTKGIVNGWNPGAEKMFGYAPKEIVGRNCEILFTPEDREKGVPAEQMQTAVEKGKVQDERLHIRKDGSRFFYSGIIQPLRDGVIDGFVKIARDLSERIKTEKLAADKEMLQKLVGAQEDERRRIARDLHDELGQLLTALRLKLEAVRRLCEDNPNLSGAIDETQTLAKRVDEGVDFLAWELRPAALDDLGLRAALEKYVAEWSHYSGVSAELIGSAAGKKMRLAPEAETNLYRIAQEALNNVHKHAKAKWVEVSLEKRGAETIILIIADDGRGFDAEDKMNRDKGIGLIGMKERAALIGGTLEIESAPAKGTTVFVRVPIALVKKENFDGE